MSSGIGGYPALGDYGEDWGWVEVFGNDVISAISVDLQESLVTVHAINQHRDLDYTKMFTEVPDDQWIDVAYFLRKLFKQIGVM